ncbi:MarR family transcriptional regulator [Mesorhizobium sp. BAC0120]|uniref:MarR family winged helix-turn-helix transcriptional regulator n=1 Tax=Mesorhizobium sp. BAC0120 TaxID=3090670 RepID=UPI00298D5D5D|nr:MarR family transcriptional regulator [Mesorhizobium sp. BAC0120]MDW6026502.1 MarR family transcriptional regulator [Mesorhizobium sp. BAC0120]
MSPAKPRLALVTEHDPGNYRVDRQVGFVLRKANQRHVAIFASHITDLTPPQFAALSKLADVGEISQNQLGALVAMDAATIKGVIDRLKARGLVDVARHAADKRRLMLRLTEAGRDAVARLTPLAERITAETLAPLSQREAATLLKLLTRIA